jgi:hypothetical protein
MKDMGDAKILVCVSLLALCFGIKSEKKRQQAGALQILCGKLP